MSIFKEVRDELVANKHTREEGKDLVIYWSKDHKKLSTVLPGLQHSRYICVTGGPKSAKTQLADKLFVLEPLAYLFKNRQSNLDIKISYFSLELSKKAKIQQIISNQIYQTTGHRLAADDLQSQFERYILKNDIVVELYTESYSEWFDFLESKVTFIDNLRSPEEIFAYMRERARQTGKFYTEDNTEVIIPANANWDLPKYQFFTYRKNNPFLIEELVVDHVGLYGDKISNRTLKQLIDVASSNYYIYLRDRLQQTIIAVQQQALEADGQQYNTSGKSILQKLKPSHATLGDSRATSRDYDLVLGLFHPWRSSVAEYPAKDGFDITVWQEHYRELSILLNRRGGGNIEIDMFFDGATNEFREITETPEDFNQYPEVYKTYSDVVYNTYSKSQKLKKR